MSGNIIINNNRDSDVDNTHIILSIDISTVSNETFHNGCMTIHGSLNQRCPTILTPYTAEIKQSYILTLQVIFTNIDQTLIIKAETKANA